MERNAILRHSFVTRLEQDLRMDGQLQFNTDLDLPSNYMVKFFGLRGATTHRILYSGQFQDCEKFHPTRVFLQIGTNDIGSALSNIDVIQGIRRVVDSLLSFSDVKRVIVGSLFQRTNPRGLTAEDYNSRVDQINIFLQRFYAESKSVHFWGIRGLMRPTWDISTSDGIHLNLSATRKYAALIRMAVKCEQFRWLNV